MFLEISRLKEEIETCSKRSKIFCEIILNIKRHFELILFLKIVSNDLVLGTRYVSYSFNEINKQTTLATRMYRVLYLDSSNERY